MKNVEYNFTETMFDEAYQDTITMSETYSEKLEDLDDGDSVTTLYSHTFKARVSQALLLTFDISDNQLENLVAIIVAILDIESECNCLLDGIKLTTSIENEIIFYHKSQNGVSLLSVDSDGDILLNFTGYKSGFKTDRFSFGSEIDFESLIYNFLSR